MMSLSSPHHQTLAADRQFAKPKTLQIPAPKWHGPSHTKLLNITSVLRPYSLPCPHFSLLSSPFCILRRPMVALHRPPDPAFNHQCIQHGKQTLPLLRTNVTQSFTFDPLSLSLFPSKFFQIPPTSLVNIAAGSLISTPPQALPQDERSSLAPPAPSSLGQRWRHQFAPSGRAASFCQPDT